MSNKVNHRFESSRIGLISFDEAEDLAKTTFGDRLFANADPFLPQSHLNLPVLPPGWFQIPILNLFRTLLTANYANNADICGFWQLWILAAMMTVQIMKQVEVRC